MTDAPVEFDRVAAECLDAIASGRATVEECLAQYPAHREALRPLLEIAAGLGQTRHVVSPSPAFTSQAGARLQARLAESARPPVPSQPSRPVPQRLGWRPTLPIILAAAALVFVIGGGILAALADRAAPGEPLYGLDRALERLSLALANDEADIDLQVRMAQERLDEARRLTAAGHPAEAETALEDYQIIIDNLEASVPNASLDETLENLEEQREQFPTEEPTAEPDEETPTTSPTDDADPVVPSVEPPTADPTDPTAPPSDDASGPDAPGKSEDAQGNPQSSDAPGNWQDAPGQNEDKPTGPGNNNAGGNSDDADDTGNGSGKDNNGGGQSNNSDPPGTSSSEQSETADVSESNNPGNDNSNNPNSNAGEQGNGNSGQSDNGGGNSGNKGGNKGGD